MCGIAGIWQKTELISKTQFTEALALMRHRGPDEQGVVTTKHMLMGTQRLKIIAPEEGAQPMQNKAGHSLVFNGAIYNYPELAQELKVSSQSDTEILFQCLIKSGEGCVNSLKGMFAFAFYDKSSEKLILARDRIGQKPLYYFQNAECFIFASELKALVKIMRQADFDVKINEEAIYHYLCLSNIPEPETIYKNVYAVKPGHFLSFQNGIINEKSYWTYTYQPKWHLSKKEIHKTSRNLIENATKMRLRADVPVGLFLSGGWDSSVIAYEASKINQNIKTYTIEYPFSTSQNESKIAQKTASSLGLSHEIIPLKLEPLEMLQKVISTFDQPFADTSAIPNLAIAKAAGQHVKVMLNGDGGDEQFGGYRRYFLANHYAKFNFLKYLKTVLPHSARRTNLAFAKRIANISAMPTEEQYLGYTVDMWRDSTLEHIWKDKSSIKNTTKSLIANKSIADLSKLDQLMNLDRHFNLLSGILVKMDRCSMAYSVEARSPFLDHELFEFTSRLPDSYKISGFNRKVLLKELYKDKLPEEVAKGKKVSFEAPINQWIDQDFQSIIKDLLLNPQAKIYKYLEPLEVKKLILGQQYKDLNVAYLIYSLLVLELWLIENA